MLVDEDDADVRPRLSEILEGLLDRPCFRLVVDDEEVPLLRGTARHVLHLQRLESARRDKVLRVTGAPSKEEVGPLTPTPARRRPVTEFFVPC